MAAPPMSVSWASSELWSLPADPISCLLIVFVFTVSVYAGGSRWLPESLHHTHDCDRGMRHSQLSERSLMRSTAPTSCHLS